MSAAQGQLGGFAALLRLSLAPTVFADLAAGVAVVLAATGGAPLVARIAPASLLLFCGGMALNGWVDREEDGRTRPERPIPSGRVAPGAALAFAIVALLAAPFAAAALLPAHRVDAACGAAGIGALIGLYHTRLKRHGLAGPLLLGAVRAGDLLLGAIAAAGFAGAAAAAPWAAAHGLYVVGASLVAHEEDRAPRLRRAQAGVALAATAVAAGAVLAMLLAPPHGALLIALVVALWQIVSSRAAFNVFAGDAEARPSMAACARLLLSRLPLIPAAACFASGASDLGIGALLVLWLVLGLARVIPPT